MRSYWRKSKQRGRHKVPTREELHSPRVHLSCPIHSTKSNPMHTLQHSSPMGIAKKQDPNQCSLHISDTAQLLIIYFARALKSNFYMECIS